MRTKVETLQGSEWILFGSYVEPWNAILSLQTSWEMAKNGIDGYAGLRAKVYKGDKVFYDGTLGVTPLPGDKVFGEDWPEELKPTCRQCFEDYKPSKSDDGFCSDYCATQFDQELIGEYDE